MHIPVLTRALVTAGLLAAITVMAQEPGYDPEAEYKHARELSYAGQYDAALQVYGRLLADHPDNADYLLGQGQALLWRGDAGPAAGVLRRVVELAPDYEDAYRALARAYEHAGQAEQAETVYAEARRRFNEPAWAREDRRVTVVARERGLVLGVSNRQEFLSNHDDDWRDTGIAVTTDLASGAEVTLAYTNSSRFGFTDHTASGEVYLPVTDNGLLYAELRVSPGHEVLPGLSAHLQWEQMFGNGYGVIGGYKRVEYTGTRVNLFDLGGEYYFGNYRAAYTAVISDSNNAGGALSHRFQLGYSFESGGNLQLAVSTGSEVEKPLDAARILKTDFTNISAWGKTPIAPDWWLTWAAGYTDLSVNDSNDSHRLQFTLGLDYHF